MSNKYSLNNPDKHGNEDYDFVALANDMKKVILGKIKMNKHIYEVMMLRFTIAHYNMYGWIDTYNGNWAELGNELKNSFRFYGDYVYAQEQNKAIDDLAEFLIKHNDVVINL